MKIYVPSDNQVINLRYYIKRIGIKGDKRK